MIHAFLIGFILFVFGHYQNHEFPKWSYYGAFLISSFASMAVAYYFAVTLQSGDTLAYFQAAIRFNTEHTASITCYLSSLLTATIPEHASNWHSVFFIKMISPIVYLSDNNFWLSGLYLTLISFILRWIALKYLLVFSERKWLIYLSLFLFPSVNVWSGGLFKEAIANSLFLLLVSVLLFRKHELSIPTAIEWILMFVGGFFLLNTRFYLFGIWIAFGLTFFWFETYSNRKTLLWSGIVLILVVCFLGAQFLHPWLRPSRLPLTLYEIYEQVLASPSTTSFTFSSFQPDYWHLLITSPLALLTGLFRPTFLDVQSLYWVPFQLEKFAIVVLAVLSIWKVRFKHISLVCWTALFYISVLTIALTLVTPNFGSLIRYQSAYLPFLIMILGWIPLRKLDRTN